MAHPGSLVIWLPFGFSPWEAVVEYWREGGGRVGRGAVGQGLCFSTQGYNHYIPVIVAFHIPLGLGMIMASKAPTIAKIYDASQLLVTLPLNSSFIKLFSNTIFEYVIYF